MLHENFGVCTSEQTCQLKTHMAQKHVAHIRLTELNYVAGRLKDHFSLSPLLSLLLLNFFSHTDPPSLFQIFPHHPQFSFPEGHNSSSGLYDQNFCSKTFCIYLHQEPASTIKHTRVLCLRQKITDMLLGDCLALICAQRPGRLNNRGLGLCMLSKVHCLSHTGTFV